MTTVPRGSGAPGKPLHRPIHHPDLGGASWPTECGSRRFRWSSGCGGLSAQRSNTNGNFFNQTMSSLLGKCPLLPPAHALWPLGLLRTTPGTGCSACPGASCAASRGPESGLPGPTRRWATWCATCRGHGELRSEEGPASASPVSGAGACSSAPTALPAQGPPVPEGQDPGTLLTGGKLSVGPAAAALRSLTPRSAPGTSQGPRSARAPATAATGACSATGTTVARQHAGNLPPLQYGKGRFPAVESRRRAVPSTLTLASTARAGDGFRGSHHFPVGSRY